MSANIADRKLHAIELLTRLEDEDMLFIIEQLLLKVGDSDWGEGLTDSERSDLQTGIENLDKGQAEGYDAFSQRMKERFQ